MSNNIREAPGPEEASEPEEDMPSGEMINSEPQEEQEEMPQGEME